MCTLVLSIPSDIYVSPRLTLRTTHPSHRHRVSYKLLSCNYQKNAWHLHQPLRKYTLHYMKCVANNRKWWSACRQMILDSVSQAYLTETLTEQSFCVAMMLHLSLLEEKRCRKVLAKFTHELKRRVKTSAAAPERQSALRSQTSPLTLYYWNWKHDDNKLMALNATNIDILSSFAGIVSYVCVALKRTSETTHNALSFLARRMCSAYTEGSGRVLTWMIGARSDHTYLPSPPIDRIIDQLESS